MQATASREAITAPPAGTVPVRAKRDWSGWIVGGFIVAAMGAGGWHFFFAPHEEESSSLRRPKPEPAAVTVEKVQTRTVRRTIDVVGSLGGWEQIAVAPKVEGRAQKLHVDVGSVVRPGDVLLELDPEDYRLALTAQERALELELAKLGLKEPPPAEFDTAALPTVQRTLSLANNAENQLQRIRSLYERKSIAKEQLDTAETEVLVAKANHEQAVLEAGVTLASVREKQAAVAESKKKLADAVIVAPTPSQADSSAQGLATPDLHYVVLARNVSEGEMVRVGGANALFTLAIDQPLKLRAAVPESRRSEVEPGQKVEFTVEGFPGEQFTGEVFRVNPAVERISRTFEIEVRAPNPDRKLTCGMFARAKVLTRTSDSAIVAPEESIVRYAGVVKAFVVRDGKAVETVVKLGDRVTVQEGDHARTWVEVQGEIAPGDVIVTGGQTQLSQAREVRIHDPNAVDSSATGTPPSEPQVAERHESQKH
ncbi:MAG TPA: efflux RND transporter periplasmic adaptor subunit [Pirellulales bacterium]